MSATRREFIGGMATALLAQSEFATRTADAADSALPNAQQARASTPKRRSIATMAASDPDLEAYRTAIEAMRALPVSDPRNWTRQADIHSKYCPHRNWWFLPWHRAYLTAFERICRELSGKQDFALPYWDWSVLPRIPPQFVEGTPASNPLNHTRPGLAPGAEIRLEFVGPDVVAMILQSPDFESLGSSRPEGQASSSIEWLRRPGRMDILESGPHNTVHSTLMGDMRTSKSPLDPIFWLHHCNIDRIWAIWNAQGGNNSSEALWLDLPLHGQFVNADASPWDVKVADLIDVQALEIAFESVGATPAAASAAASQSSAAQSAAHRLANFRKLLGTSEKAPASSGHSINENGIVTKSAHAPGTADIRRPLQVRLNLERNIEDIGSQIPAPTSVNPRSLGHLSLNTTAPRVMAIIQDIPAPAEPGTSVRVFLNKTDLKPDTPITDPHYVTSFSFFDHTTEPSHDPHRHEAISLGSSVEIDLTTTLARLQRLGRIFGTDLIVQLVAVAPAGASPETTGVVPAQVDVVVL